MIEREKFDMVINGIECCISGNTAICKRLDVLMQKNMMV